MPTEKLIEVFPDGRLVFAGRTCRCALGRAGAATGCGVGGAVLFPRSESFSEILRSRPLADAPVGLLQIETGGGRAEQNALHRLNGERCQRRDAVREGRRRLSHA